MQSTLFEKLIIIRRWISAVARDEVEATSSGNGKGIIVVTSGDEDETDEEDGGGGGMRSQAEELRDTPNVRGMINALRTTPGTSLAGVVGSLRRELASGMVEVLMDDPRYAKELADGGRWSANSDQITPQGTPRHWQETPRGASSDRMRKTMTEKFRSLEPSSSVHPEYHYPAPQYSTPQRSQTHLQQDEHEASSRTEPRVQVIIRLRPQKLLACLHISSVVWSIHQMTFTLVCSCQSVAISRCWKILMIISFLFFLILSPGTVLDAPPQATEISRDDRHEAGSVVRQAREAYLGRWGDSSAQSKGSFST